MMLMVWSGILTILQSLFTRGVLETVKYFVIIKALLIGRCSYVQTSTAHHQMKTPAMTPNNPATASPATTPAVAGVAVLQMNVWDVDNYRQD